MRKVLLGVAVATALVASSATTGRAAVAVPPDCTVSWDGPTGGTWDTAANWSPARVPTTSDIACVGPGGQSARVAASTTVAGVRVEGSTLRVAGGVTLEVQTSLVVHDSTVAGPGTIHTDNSPGSTAVGPAQLTTHVHLELDTLTTALTGRVVMSGGAVVAVRSSGLDLTSADLVDADHDPGNRLSAGPLTITDATGSSHVGVRYDIGANLQVATSSRLVLDRLDILDANGVLGGTATHPSGIFVDGTLVLPRTVTRVVGHTTLFSDRAAARTITPAGVDALSTLTTVSASTVGVARSLTLSRPLTVSRAGGRLLVGPDVTLTVPSLLVTQGWLASSGTIALPVGGAVTFDDATNAAFDTVDGTVRAIGSTLYGRTAGGLSLDADSAVATCPDATSCPPLHVTGDATIAGTVQVTEARAGIPVGTRFVVLQVDGTLTGTFSGTTLREGHQPVALSYEPTGTGTQVVATVTG